MTPTERLQAALDGASRAFPSLPAQFEGGTSIAWSEEPWERGAYVWFKPGQMTTLAPHLAPAEGRIHFAGDHTTWLPGWMQGALASGRRVAAEIGGG
jgi:monoamine oxidase